MAELAQSDSVVHLDKEDLLDEPGVRTALAVALFKDGSLSLGRAAKLAGMPLVDFMQHLSRLGVPVVEGDAQSLREDLADLDARLGEPS